MTAAADIYARKALCQIPRLLGNQDRNPFSPTYGCFHRDYWLDKTSDFPDAVRQFAVHALALVYRFDFPGNIYKANEKIRDWVIAGLDFWARIQHNDGSFDEFYPYERGWVGPSAFTTFTSVEAYTLLKDEIPTAVAERVRNAIRRAATFIAAGESEADYLANHHAMACLAVWKAYRLLGDPVLEAGYRRLWEGFLSYHNAEEGWSREYDGVDPGYLSATVSFLGKIYQDNRDSAILEVLRQSVEFCSYFVYPNGFYAGSLGSRNTLHFYPHGFEILAREVPLAAAIAEKMLAALGEDKLVPPEIISDRYVVYRVPEFLQAYLDYGGRPAELAQLPYERKPFSRYYPAARIFVANRPRLYVIANLAKGGVVKVFDRLSGRLVLNDCGLIGRLEDGRVVSSQWIDPQYQCRADDSGWEVSGPLHVVPSNKLFTPLKNLIFRAGLVSLGWIPTFSHLLKGQIRKALILGQRAVPIRFRRCLRFDGDRVLISDEIRLEGKKKLTALSMGDEFFVRHVPQSRYFQAQELDVKGFLLLQNELRTLNSNGSFRFERVLDSSSSVELASSDPLRNGSVVSLPVGVYDIDYHAGRRRKRQLIYRLQRRTDEVETALRRYSDGRLRTIVDVGTADGLMLEKLRHRFGPSVFIGLDYNLNLLRTTTLAGIYKVQGDALALPVKSGQSDAVIAAAVIEHVPDAGVMLQECARILRPGGLLIVTTPDPVMDRVASAIGLLKETGHQHSFTLRQLKQLVEANGFEAVECRKFMFSPVGFPAEQAIEKALNSMGLSFLLANQLLIAKKLPTHATDHPTP